ncbi:hypothetical protein P8935_09305 [Telmatobacter sp. DSM 110680]|uniref:Uncharacterized protein n=1 Tax=Telmatobacter sp. DSM 110680 TaxID=3036704 RepID=A0AAU7DQD0_9BACT
MKQPSDVVISLFDDALLRAASLIVPTIQREEWRREWCAELWHVRRSCIGVDETFSWEAQREITGFCLGAFSDALCLRTQPQKGHPAPVHIHGSAAHTLLWLFAALALCFVISQLLPGVAAENEADRYQISPGVLLVSEAAADDNQPSISSALFHNWKTTRQRYFQDLAFYSLSRESANTGRVTTSWNVAHSSENLFSLLGLPIENQADTGSGLPSVVLSHDTWMRSFAGDPHIAGRAMRIGKVKAQIAGVAPAGAWQLPGSPDVWLLEPNSSATSPTTSGYLFAHLSARGQSEMTGSSIGISALNENGISIDLNGSHIDAPVEGPWGIYEFAIFLALVALPAVTSVSLGDSHVSSHRPSMKQRLNRIMFLTAKFALIAAIGYAASLDLAYSNTTGYSPFAECLQLLWGFTICLFGFRWAIADQRKRCPVCLRRVTNPATVGLASRTFLGWNGTEMICMGGHALLHVPSLPTSWFSGQRWLYLDSSWEFLFADSYI